MLTGLKRIQKIYKISAHAWLLMTNHVHFVYSKQCLRNFANGAVPWSNICVLF
jgi:hypothetical protein